MSVPNFNSIEYPPLNHEVLAEKREAELKQKRLARFAQVFNRVDTVLATRPINVSVVDVDLNSPAWSNSREVVFNSKCIGDLNTPESIASVKGLNLHEVSHVLFTPRNGSEIATFVGDNNLWQAFNALEDCRIETLMIGRYPSTINWFVATISMQLLDSMDSISVAYPLIAGRLYLPAEIRNRARNMYVNQNDVDELREITTQYRELNFPADTEIAKDLIVRYDKLIESFNQEMNNHDCSFGHGERPMQGIDSSSSRPVKTNQQKSHLQNAKRFDKGADDSVSPANQSPANESTDSADSADSNSTAKSDNNAQQANQSTDSKSQSQTKSQSSNTSKSTSKTPSKSAGNEQSDYSEALLENVLNKVLNSADVKSEIDDLMRQLNGLPSLTSNSKIELSKAKFNTVAVDSVTVESARAFGRELERLKANSDPAWDKKLSSGKLNAKRAMLGDKFDSVFDQWNSGRADATEIECVVLLDNSGSMEGNNARVAYSSMFAIKSALDKISANTTVVTFNNKAEILYDKRDKAGVFVRDGGAQGGTDPSQAIEYATKLLAQTDKPIKILFVITDGEWNSYDSASTRADEAIKNLKLSGVLTALAFIDDSENARINSHNCELVVHVKNPNHLITLAKSLVKTAIARRLTNA